jgi:K+-sensing histidine kinase KdpD
MLRTPINAIQGFAEMIQQQVFGATPHQYRSLAASIAADAARMLAGFEDLERLARLETGAADMPAPQADTDLAALLARQIAQLDPVIGPREVRLRWNAPAAPLPVRAPAAELEHAVWRLLAVIASTAAPGERLAIALDTDGDQARLDLPLPATLAMRDDATLFAADSARPGQQQPGRRRDDGQRLCPAPGRR